MLASHLGALVWLPFGIAACSVAPGGFASGGGSSGPDSNAVGGSAGGQVISGPEVGFGGAAGGVAGPGVPGDGVTCATPVTGAPVFGPQVFSDLTPARAELYSWATDAQVASMRKDHGWLPSVAATDSIGGTLAALIGDSGATGQLAQVLNASLATARVAWPEPWAVRLGPQGEDPGKNLVRIVLKPEAWVAVVEHGTIEILDMQNQRLQLADAVAAPERLGAIVHVRDDSEGGPSCGGFSGNGNLGFREMLVGNLGMISEWSLGTEQIQTRLMANVAQLSEFLARTRSCPDQSQQASWNAQVVCNWQSALGPSSEQSVYQQALANPTLDYFDAPPQLGALIDRLEGDLFELDPLTVTPGSP